MTAETKNKLFNRELSWIEFNARVLAEAADSGNPLLERLKFTGIVSSNFDEFFMVRVASLKETDEIYRQVYQKAFQVIDKQNQVFMDEIVPALEKEGIVRTYPKSLSDKQREYVKSLFQKELLPLLTPIAVRENQEAPFLANLSLYQIFKMKDLKDPGVAVYAIVEVPKNFPRIVSLPADEGAAFILAEDIISLFGGELFQGYEITEQGLIRLTRAAEMELDEEKDEDFAEVMSEALRERKRSHIVRLEASVTDSILDFFRGRYEISDELIYRTHSWLDLKTVSQLAFQTGFDNLKRPEWNPCPHPDFEKTDDVWALLKEKDVLIHYPYESFDAFIRFLNTAAEDADVLAIKQTLYRMWSQSAVISALEKAVHNGKQVTVLVELKARFDEASNIEWARRLERAGATVLYGVAGLKTHSKACLVVRREIDGIQRYLHLGTGNYNEKTAQIYSDLGLFTTNELLANDVASYFNIITGYSHPVGFSKIDISPYGLRRKLQRLILRESLQSRGKQPGRIIAKMNSLVDPDIIEALYRASQKGVKIKLNVRGICRLRPGIEGLSENIEVTSIVDMFLEHSRIFYFYNEGNEEIFLSSADWMPRNLDRRLEIMFPVESREPKKELIDLLDLYFKDNMKSWRLLPDGTYQKNAPGEEKKFRAQEYLCRTTSEKLAAAGKKIPKDLKPQKPKK